MFGEAKDQQETQTVTEEDIDPQILSRLGLTQEDVQKADQEKLKEQRYLETAKKHGADLYEELKKPSSLANPIINVEEAAIPITAEVGFLNRSDVPDLALNSWKKAKAKYPESYPEDSKKTRRIENRLKAVIEGYGNKALASSDLKTAVNAYDIVTEGGILQNEEALGKLKEIAQEDKTVGVEIAQLIQERVNRRKQQASHQPPAPRPAPDQQLRPAPPPPSE